MRSMITDLSQWPSTKGWAPVFTCTEDAIFFAHLIFKKEEERLYLARLKKKALFDIKLLRSKITPSYQRMLDLAVKGQFYRECLEELERIEQEGP